MKAKKALDQFDIFHKIDGADKLTNSLGTKPVDHSGTDLANQAIADAQTQANELQKNFSTDLSTNNLTQAVAGSDAQGSAMDMTNPLKRKRTGSGLSSALGIGG